MISRRDFLQAAMATSALTGSGVAGLARAQGLTEAGLVDMAPLGNVTLIHLCDIHGQLKPVWYREPSVNLGVGDVAGLPPHVTGADFLKLYDIEARSPRAYALSSVDFAALARDYGRLGGLDRVATVVKRIRAERPGALLLDAGDTWQGSLTCLRTAGQDMVDAMNLMQPDAMTSHWDSPWASIG